MVDSFYHKLSKEKEICSYYLTDIKKCHCISLSVFKGSDWFRAGGRDTDSPIYSV